MDVFVHIPKTSGSTIRAILSREYGVESIIYYEPGSSEWSQGDASPAELLNARLARRPARLITGHYPFGIHSFIKSPCRYFSMVRDPIDRALSDYYYAYVYRHHRQRDQIHSGELSIAEFMTNSKFGHGTEQTGMLAGNFASYNGVVQAAIENIQNCFNLVGVAERFDESLLLIAKRLGWRPPLYVKKNVTKLDERKQADRSAAYAYAREHFMEEFRDDYAVYRAAEDRLSQLIQAEGRTFHLAVEAFREIQEAITARAKDEIFELYEFQQNDALPDYAASFIGSVPYRAIEDYLADGDASASSRKNYVGSIDALGPRQIAGWAGDLTSERPIHVTIWRARQRLSAVSCNIIRDDLLHAGFKIAEMGFCIKFDAPINDIDQYTVCFEDSAIFVPKAQSRLTT